MTKQQIFDKVAKHLLTQMERSVATQFEAQREPSCSYRGIGGLQGAVGCLINDEEYCTQLEGNSAYSSDVQQAVAASLGISMNELRSTKLPDMLLRLQEIHDDTPPYAWRDALKEFAQECGLQVNF